MVKMNINDRKICRLCLKVVTNEFVEIDEVIRKMFDILLLKLDLNIIREPIVCRDCVEIAKKCLKLKLTCLGAGRTILLFSANMENAKHDIKVIYKESGYARTVVNKDLAMCGICLVQPERNNSVILDTLRNEDLLFEMISGSFPEMDVNMFSYPMICTTCRGNLKCFLKFVLNCLDTEEKIKSFCKEQGTDDRIHQMNLGNVLYFLTKDILERPNNYSQICKNKGELDILEDTECVYPEAGNRLIKLEELNIKEEEIHLEGKSCKLLPEIRLDMLDKVISNKTHKCPLCAYEFKQKKNVKRHMLTHKDVSEIKMHKCSLCAFESKHKVSLKRHMLVHKDVSEIKMHKCQSCTFETKRKGDLKNHILRHKDVSEIKMHKCPLCAHETKHKRNLGKHMLVHNDASAIMHKCSLCAYGATAEYKLKSHMLVHNDISKIKMHKCPLCTHETKRKRNLKNHIILVHKVVSEIKT